MDELLGSLGCKDIDGTKARFMDDKAFYLEIANELLGESGFEELGDALQRKDRQAAFDIAHNLKGVIANCGMTPLYESAVKVVDPLRGDNPDYQELMINYAEFLRQRDIARNVLGKA